MGLWDRLFGRRATAEERIARARQHVDDDEPEQAIRVLAGVDGDEAAALREQARARIEGRDAALAREREEDARALRLLRLQATADDRAAARAARAAGKAAAPADDAGADDAGADDAAADDEDAARAAGAGAGAPYRQAAPPRRAPDPAPPGGGNLAIDLHPDGTMSLRSGGSTVQINAPTSDDDGRPRSTDGLAVARRLVAALVDRPLEAPAYPFIDASWLLARAGEPAPRPRDPARRALAALVAAAVAGDADAVTAALRAEPADPTRGAYAATLVASLDVGAQAALAVAGLIPPHAGLLRRLAAADPDACAALVASIDDAEVAARAHLAILDAGHAPPAALAARWRAWDAIAEADRDARHAWLSLEVRRLARVDLDAALALEPRLPAEHLHDADASLAVAARLARVDGRRALAHAAALRPDADHLPWLSGCVRAGAAGAGDLVDAWIAALGAGTYDPYAYFAGVLAACLDLGDALRVRRLLAAAGPTGWQVAHAARWRLGVAAARDPAAAAALLAALLERHPPGVVSGRAMDRGALRPGAGRIVFRPAWLELTDPHPVETLALVVALGADGPRWDDDALP